MLRSIKELQGYQLQAKDDTVGRVEDFFFDDSTWNIRYLVADTGTWLSDRLVLLSPESLTDPNWADRTLPVELTQEQIENSPELRPREAISRDAEADLATYYGWPTYWAPAPVPILRTFDRRVYQRSPGDTLDTEGNDPEATPSEPPAPREPDLQRTRETIDNHIHALDGEIGHVEDFIVDTDEWCIRYMVVDTRNWLPGKKVLVSPEWIDDFDWAKQMVHVHLTQDQIRNSPEFDPTQPINREYEAKLYDYYGVPRYWQKSEPSASSQK